MTEHAFPTPEIRALPEQHLAVVRERVTFDRIRGLYDRAFPMIFAALRAAGLTPASAPMGVMHGDSSDALDLSVAVPVASPFAAAGEVTGETIPAGRAATLLVRGDYELIAPAYGALFAWIAEHGLTPSGTAWEQYLTEPQPGGDAAANETLIAVLLQE